MRPSRFFLVGIGGKTLTGRERDLFSRHPPGGVILFGRNIVQPSQLRDLVGEIRGLIPGVWLAVDQEGGPVDRFREIAGASASAAKAAAAGESEEAGRLAGNLCSAFGIDVDLAPVVDRAVRGAGSIVLSERVVSENPEEVVRFARAFLDGLSEAGVAGCLKHFPGLGRGAVDSHLQLPIIRDESRELNLDLAPFEALRSVPAVMVSHAALGSENRASSLSKGVATDLLRGEMGFDGAAFSDDLEMGALSAFGSLPDRCAAALAAGCDVLCVGKDNAVLPEAVEAIERTVATHRIEEAAARVERLRGDLARIRAAGLGETLPLDEITRRTAELRSRSERPG